MILNNIDNARLGTDQVDKIYLGNEVVWQNTPPGPVPYEQQYLTFGVLSDGNIVWAAVRSAEQPITIEYSKNDGPWTQITSASGSSAPVISVVSGDTVRFRGDNLEYIGYKQVGASRIPYKSDFSRSTCTYNLYGNMMSMIDSTGFAQITSIPSGMNITHFFGYQGPVDASNMVLPATTLAEGCYVSMFSNCTSLTTAPELPATTLADSCYQYMFNGCTNLTTAPALPATTLADSCYDNMFSNCTSLTTAPALPATTLERNCYDNMFEYCTSLTAAPVLPATTLAYSCYQRMFSNCTSLTTAPALPATTLAYSCYQRMFSNCTSLTTAPALPATTLVIYCYDSMFSNCTSLTTAPELPATTLAEGCYWYMFENCTSLATAPALPATTLADSCYQYMFSECTSLDTITCLATNPNDNYTRNWVMGVASTGTFVKKAGVNWPTGASGIPRGWTVVKATT